VPREVWRTLFDNALEGMLLAMPNGNIVAANAVACRMLGRTEADLQKLAREDLTVMDDAASAFFDRRDREGRSRGRLTLRRADGSTLAADASSTIVDAPEGTRVHVRLVDVTEDARERRTLEILAKAGRVLGESLDIKETLQRLLSLVVPELADIAAVDLLESAESHRFVVAHRDPTSQAELVKEELARASTLGTKSYVSVPLIARGRTLGALTLASTGGVPAYDEHGLELATALAHRAALAVDNAFTHAAALQATRLRDDVLEIVSHDLKNPLNTIKLSAGSLARHSDAEEIPVLRRAVERAERLIKDLLLVAKMDLAKISLDRGPTSVQAILDGVVALHEGAAAAKSLALVSTVEGQLDVVVDRHRVAQMLDNLVANAIQITESGSVELRARVVGPSLVIEVKDTGPGITPDVLPHVFDRFWQSAHAGRASAGLGLAIARGIAQAHGGDITIETAIGRGTTFTASLPIAPT